MKAFKRILALLACTALLCGCLVSCINPNGNSGDTPEESYVATYKIAYATNDDKIIDAIYAMGSNGAVLTVKGDDIKIVTNTTIDDISSSEEYIYVGGILYHASTIKVGNDSSSFYKKATMSADQRDDLISKVGAGASIGIDDFESKQTNNPGNTVEYSCEGISDEAKESLRKIFAKRFESQGATVAINDVYYELEVMDDKNQSSILSCNFTITMGGADYAVTMHLYCEYDYESEVSISAPQNVDAYPEVSVDKIIG